MKKLFTSDKFYLTVTIVGFIAFAIAIIIGLVSYPGYTTINQLFVMVVLVLCLVALYSSYKKHSKNVMKGLLGALLMACLIGAANGIVSLLIPADKICAPINLVLTLCLFIIHFVINSDHHSSQLFVRANQILCLLLAIVWIVWNSIWAFEVSSVEVLIATLGIAIGKICMYAAIVCVESRLDAYRLDREEAGWTEEAGYPEGYVHEYEKKDKK